MAYPGFPEGGSNSTVTHELFEAMPTFGAKPRPFRSFLRETISPTSPIYLFLMSFLLKHAKVSHSSSFLSSTCIDREGVPFSLSISTS